MIKRHMTFFTLLIVAFIIAACGAPAAEPVEEEPAATEGETGAETEAAASSDLVLALVPKNLGNPYFDTADGGAQEAAEELGIEIQYQGSSTADATEQIQLLNSLIAQNINGLAIAANDADALVPTGQEAMAENIPVVTWDSAIAPEGRNVHVVQATSEGLARTQIEMAAELAEGEGQIAILSATSTAPNQNEWIGIMEEILQEDEYAGLELVDIVYGDDEDEKSYNEALGLMRTYPELKVIISPTTVGIASSARAVEDQERVGEVFVTGLGTPNQMREFVSSGSSPTFALWNPGDLGYLAAYTLHAIVSGEIEGVPGDTFEAGRLGSYTIEEDSTVLLGDPTVFNADNIDDFDF
ncbi:MAG: rhamnose ABC transporter substrate-binding protein [Chloroflexota bacterium]